MEINYTSIREGGRVVKTHWLHVITIKRQIFYFYPAWRCVVNALTTPNVLAMANGLASIQGMEVVRIKQELLMVRWRSTWAGGKIKSDFSWQEDPSQREKTIELIWKIHVVIARSISTVRGCRLKYVISKNYFWCEHLWDEQGVTNKAAVLRFPLILKIGPQRPKFPSDELHFGFASDYPPNRGRATRDWLPHRIWGLGVVFHQLLASAVPTDFIFPINERWFLIEWKYLLERLSLCEREGAGGLWWNWISKMGRFLFLIK